MPRLTFLPEDVELWLARAFGTVGAVLLALMLVAIATLGAMLAYAGAAALIQWAGV
ncbi:MAG: hypothetical protein VYB54_04765 [Pseudomonadota bacterium]|nr:hypothetical protein [Pseudomonadota bacterium]